MTEFSKKTGDYPSLSATDIKVLALTYQLEVEHVGSDHLKTEPDVKVNSTLIAYIISSIFYTALCALVVVFRKMYQLKRFLIIGGCSEYTTSPRGPSQCGWIPFSLKSKFCA